MLENRDREKTAAMVVALSGSPSALSRTEPILHAMLERIGAQTGAQTHAVRLADLVPDLGIRSRSEALPRVEEALRRVESCDLLLVGLPVYNGSYPGLFKHFIDLLSYTALRGTPVGLVATGGSDRHALVVEYQLRPLFAFFGAKTLATAVFVSDSTIVGGTVSEPSVSARLDRLLVEAVQELTRAGRPETMAAT